MTDKASDQVATRKDIDDILGILKGFVQQTSDQFILVNDRLDKFEFQVNARFDKIESQIIDLQKSHDKLLNTVDKFISRIDNYETEQIARDSQFEKLLEWARKVSVKTGIPLENL